MPSSLDPNETMRGWAPELRANARRAGRYLVEHQYPDGSFIYRSDPIGGRPSAGYNLLRHAGTTWTLYTLAETLEHDEDWGPVVAAAQLGVRYFCRFVGFIPGGVRVIVEDGKAKLGALGLGLLALSQSVQYDDHDERDDHVVRWMADGILSLQQSDGRLVSYAQLPDEVAPEPTRGRAPEKTSLYYPGEAILGLVRYACSGACSAELQRKYLDAAHRAARYLILTQNACPPLPPDAWFAQALELLHADTSDATYSDHAIALGCALVRDQFEDDAPPALRGGFGPLPTVSCRTAARGEGILAAYRVARSVGRPLKAGLFMDRLKLAAEHLALHVYPSGGVAMSAHDPSIRIDTVQHAIACWLGLAALEE